MHSAGTNAAVDNFRWFHRIDLGDGVVTPGKDGSSRKLRRIGMPRDLTGLTVLDVGASDGFFSFEAERRGASRVVATDVWSGTDGWHTKDAFDFVAARLQSNVESVKVSVYDLSREEIGSFDVVLFLGVLYHLRYPLLALESIFRVTKGLLILETHLDMLWTRRPAMAFYPALEVSGDPTNWWGPNSSAVRSMLSAAGFGKVKITHRYPLVFRIARALRYWRTSPVATLQQTRAVFHAYK